LSTLQSQLSADLVSLPARATWKAHMPEPGQRARFKVTASYLLAILFAWLVFYGVAFALTVVAFPDRWQRILTVRYVIAVFIVGCIFILPFDRIYDEKYRKLEKVSRDKPAA
jgi:hypothetical protein